MKYIAVVNQKMDEDEIEGLIRKGIAGAIFEIAHQNYHGAARLIELIKKLARKYNRPISIMQDISNMQDPLDLQFGLKAGTHWVASDKEEHMKLARGLDKLAGLVFKGRNLPKGVRVDSVIADTFMDPDAQILGGGQLKHLTTDHKDQSILDSLLEIANSSDSSAVAVSDHGLARALSYRRPRSKIIFAPSNPEHASRAAIYWGVHPLFAKNDLAASLKMAGLADPGQRVVDATDAKHVTIHLV